MKTPTTIPAEEVLFRADFPEAWSKRLWAASNTRGCRITRNKDGPLGILIYVNNRGMMHLHPNNDEYKCIIAALLLEVTELRKLKD